MESRATDDRMDTLRRFYELWNADPTGPAPLDFLAADFEWVNPSHAVEPGVRRGHDGWREAMRALDVAFEDFAHEPVRHTPAPNDKVLCDVIFRACGREGQVRDERAEQHLWTFRDAQLLRLEWFHDRDAALTAAGLSGLRGGLPPGPARG
jgi:ketosteroid isomerase-like protein